MFRRWLVWAEEFGMGEMGLSEEAFWSLTMPVFVIKHAAFSRAEDRQKSLVIDLALRTAHYKPQHKAALEQEKNALRRYPIRETADGT